MKPEESHEHGAVAGDTPTFEEVMASLDPTSRAVINARIPTAVACELCVSTHSGGEERAAVSGWTQSWDGWMCPAHGSTPDQAVSDQSRTLLAESYGRHPFARLNALADRIRANDGGLGEEVKLALSAIETALTISARGLQEQAQWRGYTMVSNSALAHLETRAATVMSVRDEAVWYWQGDGSDFPESLGCPVVMAASTLRQLLVDANKAGPMSGKYADVLRPFVSAMDKELHANASKGDRPGWLRMTPETALLEIYYHLSKLQKAVRDDNGPGIQEYAADVANMSMMLLDICGGLALIEYITPTPSNCNCASGRGAEHCIQHAPTHALPSIMRDATDEEIADWAERHDLSHALRGIDARAAFEDAQTLCLTKGNAQ